MKLTNCSVDTAGARICLDLHEDIPTVTCLEGAVDLEPKGVAALSKGDA